MFHLHTLGWHSFQQLCLSVLREVLGQTVQSFLDTNDGGRDGAFSGIWSQQNGELFSGRFVIQCKFTVRVGHTLTPSDLEDEFSKAERLISKNECDIYILMTNAGVSGATELKIKERSKKAGIKDFLIFGSTWLEDQIRENKHLRMMVPRVYGLGDLSQILDERAYVQAKAVLETMKEDLAVPYPDELLYSVIARYGVHAGITSPKQLLDEVFQNRKIIASVALQGHLVQLSAHYQSNADLTPYMLLQGHTLYPLYSSFVHPNIAAQAKHELLTDCRHSAEVQLGKAASKVKSPHYLRYCPFCVTEQVERFGEPFWTRRWQFPGLSVCAEHGVQLINSPVLIGEAHRHQFIALSPHALLHSTTSFTSHKTTLLAEYAQQLLNLPEQNIHPLQWSYFYHHLAYQLGFVRGKQVEHALIAQLVLGYWGRHTLASFGLNVNKAEGTNWLKCLFRKHRKAFSYLQHLLVWQACFEQQVGVAKIVHDASQLPHSKYDYLPIQITPEAVDHSRRERWKQVVAQFGIKGARKNGFEGLYIWLYRHDNFWLMQFNQKSAQPNIPKADRVDWAKRDKKYVKRLLALINKVETQFESRRYTETWLFNHASIPLSQIKYLEKLPLCKLFFNKYCETIEEYQCRRIAVACIRCIAKHQILRAWRIERMAGLNEKRTRPLASQLLGFAVKYEPSR